MKKELLRRIPKIDEVLMDKRLSVFFGTIPRDVILESVRETINEIRNKILTDDEDPRELQSMDIQSDQWIIDTIKKKLEEKTKRSLRPTINATGIVLHTNLGRAKLCAGACQSVTEVAGNYSTLEYDVKKGARGSRHDHVEKLITKITGAESAMVVNNNAAATLICLAAMAKGREVIVSRGELVEIGGSFRIPEIMAESGASLTEVGATNKTKVSDYSRAICENTGALMKVHTSNYKIIGFTDEVTLPEMVALGESHSIPVIYDMGSGLMINLEKYGIDEPTVTESLKTGIDVILFSGDKLLGGPQGGIIAGKKKYIDLMKKHPLARVLRVDKMTLAAMEATFREYLDTEKALIEIPVLRTLTMELEELKQRAEDFSQRLRKFTQSLNMQLNIQVISCQGQVGGGSAPTALLPGYAVTIRGKDLSLEKLEKHLRLFEIPIIVRIFQDRIFLDMRTLSQEELNHIERALQSFCEKDYGEKEHA